jgi:OmpA family
MYLYDSPASFSRSQNLRPPGTPSRFGEPPGPTPDLILEDFDFDRADLKQSHKNKIDQLAQQIVDSWKPASTRPALGVRAVGHTDEVGSDDYNWKLGIRRAEKVMGRLTGLIIGGDIDLYQRMTWSRESQGKKQRKPGVPANKNRRVEIFIQWGRVKTPPPPPPPPRPDPRCVAECEAQARRCLSQTRFVPGCLIGRDRCIRGCG